FNKSSSDVPSIQVFKSVKASQDPESPRLLVCLLKGLKSADQQVLWWLDDAPMTSAGAVGPWVESEWGYSATSVWEVSAAYWRPTSSYWCGTIQEGHTYRQKVCSED
uniref:Ig-like domain-containing protein n=1 Tax=Nothobranchius furzeri TaxID=105023 RepID=A0A8C6NMD8_NOTFU